jgi:hypothetical protein
MVGDSMRRHSRLLWCILVSLVMSAMLIAWENTLTASAALSAKPQGTCSQETIGLCEPASGLQAACHLY